MNNKITNKILNFSQLLAPISKRKSTGVDLRADVSHNSKYYKLKDARAAARTAERHKMLGAQEQSCAEEHWDLVRLMSIEMLQTQSKDLEIVAWLIEALLRKYGFAGLRDGFELARAMIERYWEEVYPRSDDEEEAGEEGGDFIVKVAPFIGLNGSESEGTLIVPMGNIWVTEGVSKGPYTFWQYQKAREIELIQDASKKQQRIEQSGVSLEYFNIAMAETSKDFYRNLLNDLNASVAAFSDFTAILDEKCAGGDGGNGNVLSASHISNKLRDCLECVKTITANWQPVVTGKAEGTNVAKSSIQVDKPNMANLDKSDGEISAANANIDKLQLQLNSQTQAMNRDQALQLLLTIAHFFRATEPHSPLPYVLERAVKWGKMPLAELLDEIIADAATRNHVREMIGANEILNSKM